MCPVCSKKVGAWHKDGVHPACAKKVERLSPDIVQSIAKAEAAAGTAIASLSDSIRQMTQAQRDAILRNMNRGRTER